MTRKIYIDGRHWDNIMALPCVRGLNKRGEEYVVKVKVGKASTVFAAAGDAIVEKDDGSWSVERKEAMVPRRLKSGDMLCPYYYAWIETSNRGLQVYQCVDIEKREQRTCEWTPESGCFKYPKYRGAMQKALDTLKELDEHQRTAEKVEPKFKVKYAGSEYNVLEIKKSAGVIYYGIEDEPNHIDYIKADNCEIINGGYGVKEDGFSFPTKPVMFSEKKELNKIDKEIEL